MSKKTKGKDEEEEVQFCTIGLDPRFPQQNQTLNCYINYVDYHRCRRLLGEEYVPCEYFKKVYKTFCPNAWQAKWDEQITKGTFPGNI